jgi:putative acetyltransferase
MQALKHRRSHYLIERCFLLWKLLYRTATKNFAKDTSPQPAKRSVHFSREEVLPQRSSAVTEELVNQSVVRVADAVDVPATAVIAAESFRAAFESLLGSENMKTYTTGFFADRFVQVVSAARLRPGNSANTHSSEGDVSRERSELFVACLNEQRPDVITGFYLVSGAHIDMIFVSPSVQRSGVGTALLLHAQAGGARSLEVFASNGPARAFYERHGWHVTRLYSRMYAGKHRDFVRYEFTLPSE